MSGSNGWTPTEKSIVDALADGLPHDRDQLRLCLPDPVGGEFRKAEIDALKNHVSKIRKRLRPQGLDILCQYVDKRLNYRMVRLINSSDE